MAYFGVLCLPLPSHLNLFFSLSRALVALDHRIVFFGVPEIEERVRKQGYDFCSLETPAAPGRVHALVQEMGNISGWRALRLQLQFDLMRSQMILEQGPKAVGGAAIDLLIVDQAEAAGGSVAEHLGLPWVSVSSGLCLNAEPRVPPFFTSWGYSEGRAFAWRNRLAYSISQLITRPVRNQINQFRREWELAPSFQLDETFSPYAQICQQIPEFDFPRLHLPDSFHYVGPLGSADLLHIEFPWNELDGRPLVYASLGTLLNQHRFIYGQIIEACAPLDVQLVLSLGGAGDPNLYSEAPGRPIVVTYAPQIELLSRASLTITHAGLNTTLESLSAGVPLVAIPITFEQPAIAARIRWAGAGDFLRTRELTVGRLRDLVVHVLGDAKFRIAAEGMGVLLRQRDGRVRAADIIQKVWEEFNDRRPKKTLWQPQLENQPRWGAANN